LTPGRSLHDFSSTDLSLKGVLNWLAEASGRYREWKVSAIFSQTASIVEYPMIFASEEQIIQKLKGLGMMTMKAGNVLETIAILLALISIMPVAYWWNMGELSQHRQYLYYLLFVLFIMGYVTYRKIKALRAALKSSKKHDSGPQVPPFPR